MSAVFRLVLGFVLAFGPLLSASADLKLVFEKKKIQLGKRVVTVEIADSPEKRSRGLMFRESLLNDNGMLFIFDEEAPLSFWMKNTLIPLSIGYFDRDRKLINVLEMEPAPVSELNPRTYRSSRAAMYALEMTKGWFSRNKVEPGTTFSFLSRH